MSGRYARVLKKFVVDATTDRLVGFVGDHAAEMIRMLGIAVPARFHQSAPSGKRDAVSSKNGSSINRH
jgi:pyruvate/2-oxoglutarate dehydrogenase complex dihydrolipoamide dehydrogenase (E3) component